MGENNNIIQKLKQIFGEILKLLLNGKSQEAIIVANQGILQCNLIEKNMKKKEEREILWKVLK